MMWAADTFPSQNQGANRVFEGPHEMPVGTALVDRPYLVLLFTSAFVQGLTCQGCLATFVGHLSQRKRCVVLTRAQSQSMLEAPSGV